LSGRSPHPKTLITPALFSRPPQPPPREKRENSQLPEGCGLARRLWTPDLEGVSKVVDDDAYAARD